MRSRFEPNCSSGDKIHTLMVERYTQMGRGALCCRTKSDRKDCGVYRSENAGMSSENYVRIIMAESLRFLKEGSSASR